MAQRFLLLQVVPPHFHQVEALNNMKELEQLVETYGGDVIEKSIQHRINPDPSTYIGSGKVTWVKETVKEKDIDVMVINAVAKASQIFRLEKAIWAVNPRIAVWDRVDLILNIFERHATSTEAKLQIELARITHMGPRVYGLGGNVLSRQGAGINTKGLGETNIELEKRIIKKKTQQLKKQLDHLSHTKQSRLRFRAEQGIGPVALVGYTSAGKTTLFNRLTGKEKQTHVGLFTTLDTVVGKLKIAESPLPILISDTIGFIEDLPPKLIDAFRSTLMESVEAKLLLHVIDANDSNREGKIETVVEILRDLKVEQPILIVFNKVDQMSMEQLSKLKADFKGTPAFFISAKSGIGIDELKSAIVKMLVSN
jgi:GTPase